MRRSNSHLSDFQDAFRTRDKKIQTILTTLSEQDQYVISFVYPKLTYTDTHTHTKLPVDYNRVDTMHM